jgi:hypothetical protein
MTTNRIKNINSFIDSIMTQDEWEENINIRINYLIEKYNKQLDKYNYIMENEINGLKLGGYIKYININDDLIWGGALFKIDRNNIYMKKDNEIIKINKFKNIIFYKNHITLNDKNREIFLTSLDKYG